MHDDGPHPTLCLIHGFLGSAYLFNGLFFSLPSGSTGSRGSTSCSTRCRSTGTRLEKHSPFSGYGYFADGFSGFAEAMAQAVHDFRSVLDYLEYTGVDRIALTGMSLGGYTSALIAGVDDRVRPYMPTFPAGVHPKARCRPAGPADLLVKLGNRVTGTDSELMASASRLSTPRSTTRPWYPRIDG